MGAWSALSALVNITTQASNDARKQKYIKQAQAAQAAGRGKRRV